MYNEACLENTIARICKEIDALSVDRLTAICFLRRLILHDLACACNCWALLLLTESHEIADMSEL